MNEILTPSGLKSTKVKCICARCDKAFFVFPNELRRGNPHYCSRYCYDHARPFLVRFWEKVDKSGECWLWTGGLNGIGYGSFNTILSGVKFVGAHRISWFLKHGPIPDGMFVCHSCNNPPCVNPSHLYLDTPKGNMEYMVKCKRSSTGSKNSQSKLSAEQVLAIREEYKKGEKGRIINRELALKYGLHENYIPLIVTGRRWKHLPT